MKILAYVGSRRKKSNTLKATQLLIDKIVSMYDDEVEYEIVMAKDANLELCRGCENCFNKGYCPADKIDHFDELKNKMLNADVIVIATPVYGGTVSGDVKILIDRLSYWLHLFPLLGKIGVPVVTASNNSVLETNMYLKKIMESMGLCVALSVLCTVDVPPMLENIIFKEETIPKYAEEIMNYVTGKKKVTSTDYQERCFSHLRQAYDLPDGMEFAEVKYWKDKGYINYSSYAELLESIQRGEKVI